MIQASDGDQDALTFGALGLPAEAVLDAQPSMARRCSTGRPTAADAGNYTVLVTVTDNGNGDPAHALKDQQTFIFIVRSSNQAPVWVSAGDQTVPEGQTLTAPFRAIDADGDTVTYRRPTCRWVRNSTRSPAR